MVPTRRIELRAEHYHCSVLPLYYVGLILLESYYIIIYFYNFSTAFLQFIDFFITFLIPDTL